MMRDLKTTVYMVHTNTILSLIDILSDWCGLGMDMMKMFFHGGYNEVILFDFWRISTLGGLIGSMIGCFILGILYEGLKFLREFLIGRDLRLVIEKVPG